MSNANADADDNYIEFRRPRKQSVWKKMDQICVLRGNGEKKMDGRDTDEVAGESRILVKDFTFHYAPYIFSVCVCVSST